MTGLPQLELVKYWNDELAKSRYADPKCLLRSGYKSYSQCDEDGLIEEIFRRIDAGSRIFIELGVEAGLECNTLKLLVEGWTGLWIEGAQPRVESIANTHAHLIFSRRLKLAHAFITAENIEALIAQAELGPDIDLLSIDLDLNDFWIWHAIQSIRPRVVVIEYNPVWRPPLCLTVPYFANGVWDGSNYYGASLEALTRLGQRKGYRLVGCSFSGNNAFFVRDEDCGDHFLEPATAQRHYEPARFFFAGLAAGHRPGIGPLTNPFA